LAVDNTLDDGQHFRKFRVVTTARDSPSFFLATRSKLSFLLVTTFMSQDQHQQSRTVEASHIYHEQLLQLGKMLLLLVQPEEAPRDLPVVTDPNKTTLHIQELGKVS
jgi:hypothetical protein